MDFEPKKLPKQAAMQLRNCPVNSIEPYTLLIGPAYVYFRRNEKFLAVKSPLDFFLPAELEKLNSVGSLFFPKFVDRALHYRDAGRTLRGMLEWEPGSTKVTQLMSPFELNDAVFRVLGPVWSMGPSIEPFFVSVLVNELCDHFEPEVLTMARDSNLRAFEHSVLCAALAVFIALHLGYSELNHLNRLYRAAFDDAFRSSAPESPKDESEELYLLAQRILDRTNPVLEPSVIDTIPLRVAAKFMSKMERVQTLFGSAARPMPSIHGPGGLMNGG